MTKPEADGTAPSEEKMLSRREFAIASVAAGLAASTVAEAAAGVAESNVDIRTADGSCDAVFVFPQGEKKSAAVLVWPDAFGLRPASIDVGRRLAANGYAALVVNPFYRARRAPVPRPGIDFANPEDRAEIMKLMGVLSQAAVSRDATAFLAFLDAQPEVDRKKKIGSVGFCMGGKMTIWTAAVSPARVGAAASFHGGGLVTDKPDSPHKMIGSTRASYHVAIASDDDEKEPDAKNVLRETFASTGRPVTMEVYPNAKHGWMMGDSKVSNPEQAERGWTAMLALYKQALG